MSRCILLDIKTCYFAQEPKVLALLRNIRYCALGQMMGMTFLESHQPEFLTMSAATV